MFVIEIFVNKFKNRKEIENNVNILNLFKKYVVY